MEPPRKNIPEKKIPGKMSGKERGDALRALSQISQIGITLAVCVLIGVFFGRYLDSVLGTSPWMLLVFSFLGVGAAFKLLYDMSKRI